MTDTLLAQYAAAAQAAERSAPPMAEPTRRRLVDVALRAQKGKAVA